MPTCSTSKNNNIPALIEDNQMRTRYERFEEQAKYKANPDPLYDKKQASKPKEVKRFQPKDFGFNDDNTATCEDDLNIRFPKSGRSFSQHG